MDANPKTNGITLHVKTQCKHRTILLLIAISSLTAISDAQWYWQNPLPQGNTLSNVMFVDQQTVWASSDATILKSTDGGLTWSVINTRPRVYGQAMFFLDANTGWVGGQEMKVPYDGKLLRTTDGGRTWELQVSNPYGDFLTIFFVNRRHGWAAGQGARIYHTSDGGEHWTLQANLSIQAVNALWFIDSLHGWGACNTLRRIRTTNGGNTWLIDTVSNYILEDIMFVDSLHGWQCGDRSISATTDGGRTWHVQFDTLTNSFRWLDIFMVDTSYGWVVSSRWGLILATTNGGATWHYQTNPTRNGLESIAFTSRTHGIAVGWQGTILTTTNSGETWTNRTQSVINQFLYGIHFIDQQRGWIAGWRGTVLKTTNGGKHWTSLTTGSDARLFDVYFVNHDLGWAVGDGGTILQTTNGGTSWTPQPTGVTAQFTDIEFKYYPVGWIIGGRVLERGYLFKTTNGGLSWHEHPSLALPGEAMRVQFTSETTGWILSGAPAIGSVQRVYRTTDAGNTWAAVLSNSSSDSAFFSMSFVDDSTGFVAIFQYSCYKTTDAGSTWIMLPTPEYYWDIYFVSRTHGWATGGIDGEVFFTSDGGQTWNEQGSPASFIERLYFLDHDNGWAVGWPGAILHTTNGGVTFVAQESRRIHRSGLQLLQNYPNPFNASTTIAFIVDNVDLVTIHIYNVLGQQVHAMAVAPTIGLNRIAWNGRDMFGNDVSSGVYFYTVRYKNTLNVNKMLLVR